MNTAERSESLVNGCDTSEIVKFNLSPETFFSVSRNSLNQEVSDWRRFDKLKEYLVIIGAYPYCYNVIVERDIRDLLVSLYLQV